MAESFLPNLAHGLPPHPPKHLKKAAGFEPRPPALVGGNFRSASLGNKIGTADRALNALPSLPTRPPSSEDGQARQLEALLSVQLRLQCQLAEITNHIGSLLPGMSEQHDALPTLHKELPETGKRSQASSPAPSLGGARRYQPIAPWSPTSPIISTKKIPTAVVSDLSLDETPRRKPKPPTKKRTKSSRKRVQVQRTTQPTSKKQDLPDKYFGLKALMSHKPASLSALESLAKVARSSPTTKGAATETPPNKTQVPPDDGCPQYSPHPPPRSLQPQWGTRKGYLKLRLLSEAIQSPSESEEADALSKKYSVLFARPQEAVEKHSLLQAVIGLVGSSRAVPSSPTLKSDDTPRCSSSLEYRAGTFTKITSSGPKAFSITPEQAISFPEGSRVTKLAAKPPPLPNPHATRNIIACSPRVVVKGKAEALKLLVGTKRVAADRQRYRFLHLLVTSG